MRGFSNLIQVAVRNEIETCLTDCRFGTEFKDEVMSRKEVADLLKMTPEKVTDSFEKKEITAILLENVDYWDFGTVKRYWETTHNILATYRVKSTHPFLRFLVNEKALKTWKIDLQGLGYHSRSPGVINLTPSESGVVKGPMIVMGEKWPPKAEGMNIYWNDLSEKVT